MQNAVVKFRSDGVTHLLIAEDGGEIEVWGDGLQTRSYCYIDDCVEGIYRLMRSDYAEPLNLGVHHGEARRVEVLVPYGRIACSTSPFGVLVSP